MDGKSILNCLLLGWFFAVWFCTSLIDVSVPITSVPAHRLREAMESVVFHCPFTLTLEKQWRDGPKENLLIDGGRGTMFLFREKIATVIENAKDAGLTIQWFIGQVRLDHLLIDVLSFEFVWLAILCASVTSVFVHLFIFEPFLKLKYAPPGYLIEMERAQSTYINSLMSKFTVEKLLMLAYVIVRQNGTGKEHYTSSDLRGVSVFDWTHRVTDASVFAIWFIIVWSVTSVTTAANQRFEIIIGAECAKKESENVEEKPTRTKKKSKAEKLVKHSKEKEAKSDNSKEDLALMRRLLILLTACLLISTALVSFGFTSFKVLHPLYAFMIFVESLSVVVRCVYVGYRVGWWQMVSDAAVRQSEPFQRRVYMSKRIADILLNSLATVLYTLYLITGVILNGKLIPLVFVLRLSHHLHRVIINVSDHFHGLDVSKLLDET